MTKTDKTPERIQLGDRFFIIKKYQLVWLGIILFALFKAIDGPLTNFSQFLLNNIFENSPGQVVQGVEFLLGMILVTTTLSILFSVKAKKIQRRNLVSEGRNLACDRSNCRGIMAINNKITKIPAVCRLFALQTDGINQETEKAAEEIIQSITAIENVVDLMSQNIKIAIAESTEIKNSGDNIVESLTSGLENLSQYIKFNLAERLEQKNNIQTVIKEASSLSKLTNLVKSIANQTNLLSINAAVEAARAGTYGRGFSVVSEEIRKLSNDSEKTAEDIEERINGLISSIDSNLSSMVNEQESKDNAEKMKDFTNHVKLMTQLSAQKEALNSKILKTIENDSVAISSAVMNALGGIQFQDITRQRLEQIQTGVMTLADHVNEIETTSHDHESLEKIKPLDIEGFQNKYRMESQRDIHAEFTGVVEKAESTDLPQIELF